MTDEKLTPEAFLVNQIRQCEQQFRDAAEANQKAHEALAFTAVADSFANVLENYIFYRDNMDIGDILTAHKATEHKPLKRGSKRVNGKHEARG